MKNFLKRNFFLLLPAFFLISPFYLNALRKSMEYNGFVVDNGALISFSFSMVVVSILVFVVRESML
jgi:hypothetical protein